MKIWRFFLLFLIIFLAFPVGIVHADENNCANRYITPVNPIRGRDLWVDKNIQTLKTQYSALEKYNFPATWLLQYDALTDTEITNALKDFSVVGERGVFLEVSSKLADDSKVPFPQGVRWSDPGAIFLSAYYPSQRRVIIDTLYSKFKEIFGYYPKSIGAWWIDSYSLNYIKNKYGLDAVMIVADQKTTDDYGVWGQWWGVPYYPSLSNILVPGGKKDKVDSVVIQWAQRDPQKAQGQGPAFSNFSLQANDYVRSGKDINYFKNLAEKYLNCANEVGQITIGMETGMEAVAFQREYENQLKILSKVPSLKAVTMSDFTGVFRTAFKENPSKVLVGDWVMTPAFRENKNLGERLDYNQGISFSDYFVPDKGGFLNRNLEILQGYKAVSYFPWFLVIVGVVSAAFIWKREYSFLAGTLLFAVSSYGLILRSKYQFGWQVFFGPKVANLEALQPLLILISFAIIWLVKKVFRKGFNVWFLPLSYGIDALVSLFRYTDISGYKYLGFLVNSSRLVGIKVGGQGIFLAHDLLGPIQSHALIKINFPEIWQNPTLYFIVLPIFHILLSVVLWLLYKKLNRRLKVYLIITLLCFFILYLFIVFSADPLSVVAQ